MKKLALFVHGLGGSGEGTWKKFPGLLRADVELADRYDVDTLEYPSGLVGSKPSLATCTAILKTKIENRYADYADIALIAHSQGGLISRRYIAERLNSAQPLRVSRLLTYATPHQGSGWASLIKHIPFASQQTADLDPNSQFLQHLAIAWGQSNADRRVLTKYVVAASDAIVGQVSAMGTWNPDYEVVGGVGHRGVVKPDAADDMVFQIARKFLLEEALLPGGVEADYRAPLLRLNRVERNDINRFLYGAQILPFGGREAELEMLAAFLAGPEQPFRWMVLHGSGGVGKSRLALELCLALRDEWHAGFLRQEAQEPDWSRWQPLMPTLIVIDYAARDTERTGKLLRALAGRGPADGTMRLAAPARVLLIERAGKGDWLDRIVGAGTVKAQVEAAHAASDLLLETIMDPWPIFEFVFADAKVPLPDKETTLAALTEIDAERRPLFAHFMADALSRGDDVRQFDRDRLLDHVIARSRENFWKPAGAAAADERLLALATMAGGLPISSLAGVKDELLPRWDIDHHPAVFLAMTGRESGETIAPLEPDIVGEHFALACLEQKKFSDDARGRFCNLAWQLNPLGMAQFVLRAHSDLSGLKILEWVRKSPATDGWPQVLWGMAALNLTLHFRSFDLGAARALVEDMREVARADNKVTLWEIWARGAVNLIADLAALDVSTAMELLEEIRRVAQSRGNGVLWTQWAYAAHNLVVSLAPQNPVEMQPLLDGMRRLAKSFDDAVMWEQWAETASTLMADLPPLDQNAARDLLNDMRGVAQTRGTAALWEHWAKAAVNLMVDLRSRNPSAARKLLDEMRDAAQARGEAALWLEWARAAVNLANDLRLRDRDALRKLLDEVRDVAQARNEATLWEKWSKIALGMMDDLMSRDAMAARTLLDEVLNVTQARESSVLWQHWAQAAHNVSHDLQSRDPDGAWSVVNMIYEAAQKRDDATLWRIWARAAINLIGVLRSSDPAVAQKLLEDLRTVAAELHDDTLWGWYLAATSQPEASA